MPGSGQARSPVKSASSALVAAVVALFFFWGGLTILNDILIPKLKGLFSLSYTEAMLTQFASFMAYFIVSLPAGALIARIGYLNDIVVGLAAMAAGGLMFVPASSSGVFAAFLAALFVLAGGIAILQVAANPLNANLGDPATSHSCLTLAQAFNALGTILFLPIGALIVLGSMKDVNPAALPPAERAAFLSSEAAVIGHAYVAIAAILLLVAGVSLIRRTVISGGHGEIVDLAGSFALLRNKRLVGAASLPIALGIPAICYLLITIYGWSARNPA